MLAGAIAAAGWADESRVLTNACELDLGSYRAVVEPNGVLRAIYVESNQAAGAVALVAYPSDQNAYYNQAAAVAGSSNMPAGALLAVVSNLTTVCAAGRHTDRDGQPVFQYQSRLVFHPAGLVNMEYQISHVRDGRWRAYGPSLMVNCPTNGPENGWVSESAAEVRYGFFGGKPVCVEASSVRVETQAGVVNFTAGAGSFLRGDPGQGNFYVHSLPRDPATAAGMQQTLKLTIKMPARHKPLPAKSKTNELNKQKR